MCSRSFNLHFNIYTYLLGISSDIFTSPSSAGDENDASETTSRRRDVATTLRLNNHVTPRSIAYAATQVSPYCCFGASPFPDIRSSLYFPSIIRKTGSIYMLASITPLSIIL